MQVVLQQKRQVFQISKRFSQLFIPKSAETLIDDQQKNCSNHGKGISEDGRGIAQWGGTEAHLNNIHGSQISFMKQENKGKTPQNLSNNSPQPAEFHSCRVTALFQS